MRVRKNSTEEFVKDETSVLRHYLPKDSSFSISFLEVEGEHENSSNAEIAYYVLKGEGVVRTNSRITELAEDEVFYAGSDNHVVEGSMELLVVRSPSAEDPDQDL